MRVANHVGEWIRYSRYSHLIGIAQLMWLVLLIAHYMACFWHVVTRGHSTSDSQQHLKPDLTVGEQYVADYYYAVSLIQGQGNASGTWGENLYSSVAIIVGSVTLAIVFGNVAMLVSNFNANTTNYHRKMEAVYATMDKMDLPLKLRERVNEYYAHVWLEYEALDGNIHQFQQDLTHTLGIEIGLYKHMNLIVVIQFWEFCTPDFLTQIVLNLDVRVYMPHDYVVRRHEIGSEMMMINRGAWLATSRGSSKTFVISKR
ncbi:Voltage-gated Ion Channel (VIC) Superfamily [Phytophthora cinnamomi]|uniref:Voltage-gated Ion Channel (VIC) Superfamily n=1 Tax=Phytophthora cinnamomi TaxID=4785 RepID=UPI00355A2B8F|nr:Voltage-gated Ion Channel (VIC) Superfamily [Phytophthora cinnamomi]